MIMVKKGVLMKNLKILLVIIAISGIGLINNVLGEDYAASSGIQYVQNIITQFTNQTNIRIIDSNRDQVVNIDYLKNVLNELYSKGFNWDLSDPNIRQQIATAIWNAMTPTVNNYAQQPQYINNQQAYKTLVFNSVNTLLLELSNTTFKDINQRIQTSKTSVARPLPATPPVRPLPAVPQKQPATQQSQITSTSLSDIRNGSFGNDYAKKVKEIIAFDYSQAKQIGFADLNEILIKSINQINANTSLQSAAKIENIKKTIDSLYKDLSNYHNLKPTTSPVTTASSMVFTLDLILKGALGGEYATKAKEISSFDYSQAIKVGFAALSSVLQQDIARINADKSPQATKVANLKKAIDSLYADLNKIYRTIKIEPAKQPANPQQAPTQQPQQQSRSGTSQKTNIVQKQVLPKSTPKGTFGMPAAEIVKRLPAWVSGDTYTYDLNVDVFKPVLAQYMAQNKNAQDKDIIQYFSAQIPVEFPFRNDVIGSIKTVLATQRASSPTATSSQLVSQLPVWVNKSNFAIKQAEFNKAVRAYIEKSSDDVSDAAIIKDFSDQIPTGMAKHVRDLFTIQIRSALEEFYRQL